LINLVAGRAGPGTSSGYAGCRHHLLGKGLAAFELCRRGRWPKAGHATRAHCIGNACYQRRLGSDDYEIDTKLNRQVCNRTAVQWVNGMVAAQRCRSGISGRGMQLDYRGVAAQR
jgi:hypothetical protein